MRTKSLPHILIRRTFLPHPVILQPTSLSHLSTRSLPVPTPARRTPTLRHINRLNQQRTSKMSYSNTDTGSKPADPYTAKNQDEPSLSEKVEDLSSFISSCKFGMMTTHTASSNMLVSRCMALADKVPPLPLFSLPYQLFFARKNPST